MVVIILALVGAVTMNSIEKMKKSFVFVALAAVIAMCATSCKKDESVLKFTATIELGNSKTELADWSNDQRQVVWSAGDQIKVWGYGPEDPTYANLGYVCSLTSGNGSTEADFVIDDPNNSNVERLAESSRFTAVYPADAWSSDNIVYINADQVFIPGNVYKYPMMAESNNTHLQFKNVCGIIEVKLPQVNGIRLSGMKVMADHQIAGDYQVYWNNGDPSLIPTNTGSIGSTEIEVSFPRVIDLSIANRASVLVYLPAGNHGGINIEFYTTDFTYTKITAQASQLINVTRSQITTLDFSAVSSENITWRPMPIHRNFFSVSDDLQVDIANGNLIHGVYGESGNWFIAQNAWDVYGNFEYFKDLFYWNNGSNSGGLTFPSTENFSFHDWGYLVTPNTTSYDDYLEIDTRWRMLSANEWNYLVNSGNSTTSVRANKCYFVYITDMNFTDIHRHEYNLGGILLMPDDWNHDFDPDDYSTSDVNGNFRECELSGEQLKDFLEKGCAFIPNSGFAVNNNHINLDHARENVLWLGYYFLEYPYSLNFHAADISSDVVSFPNYYVLSSDLYVFQQLRNRYAVRLVRNAKYKENGDWHYYLGFDPNQNTGSSKGKRR